jgi:hypothetical protein
MRYPYFIARRGQCWQDSWTYGDWCQYLCNRPGGQTQCAKVSAIPHVLMELGCVFLALGLVPALVGTLTGATVLWIRVGFLIGSGLALLLGPFIFGWCGFVLMKATGPLNRGAHRVLPGEEMGRGER